MNSRVIALFLAVCTFGEVISSWEDNGDSIKDLGWLFEPENNEEAAKAEGPTVCDSDVCKSLATEILRGINNSVNPCDNFYDFMCGAWKSTHPLPEYTAVWSRPQMFQQIVFRRLKEILEEKPDPEDILPVRQAKKWYRSCMDTDALEKRGVKPLESILMQVGGWPMTIDAEEWDETDHSWQRIEQHYFQITGSYIFYKFTPIWANDSLIELSNGPLPLLDQLPFQFENYTGEEYDNYKDLIVAVTQIFVDHNSANVSNAMIDKDVTDLIEFERQLSEIPKWDEEEIKTVEDFENWYDENVEEKGNQIFVSNLIKRTLDMINLSEENIKLIRSDNMKYVIKLNELMNKTPKRTIVNYIHWHFVSGMLTATTELMRNIFFMLMKHEYGIKAREPRWLECTKEMKMNQATAYAFSKKYFSEETDRNVREMVGNIQREMKDQIEKSNWLDEATKNIAVNKLEKMLLYVGTPDWFKNTTHVLNSYKGLVIGVNHFDNVLSFKRYEIRRSMRDVISGGKVIPMEMLDPLEVNAAYDPDENSMLLPAADFQPPFFTKNLPHLINYGMSGTIIGHEIGHAYDINGITMGFKKEDKKVSKEIMEMYYQRAGCFLDQFNKYYGVTEPTYEDTTPFYRRGSLGRKTRGENMADTTGLHAVFEAYKTLLKKNGPDTKLPGFEQYSDEQMFFLAFGALWCTDSTEEYEENRRAHDEHSPGNLRVIGAVSNSRDFARVFNCPAGSPMNPENKCNIWKDSEEVKSSAKRKRRHRKHPWSLEW